MNATSTPDAACSFAAPIGSATFVIVRYFLLPPALAAAALGYGVAAVAIVWLAWTFNVWLMEDAISPNSKVSDRKP